MTTLKNSAFNLGLGLLLTHEMDAMTNHEWRMLPILRSLDNSLGEVTFLLAHVPIFAVLIAFVASMNLAVRERARQFLCGFLIIHGVLHFALSGHAAYEFDAWSSTALIAGATACGIAYFLAGLLLNNSQWDKNAR